MFIYNGDSGAYTSGLRGQKQLGSCAVTSGDVHVQHSIDIPWDHKRKLSAAYRQVLVHQLQTWL